MADKCISVTVPDTFAVPVRWIPIIRGGDACSGSGVQLEHNPDPGLGRDAAIFVRTINERMSISGITT